MTDNLFQEIQEDLERQRLEALWKRYGIWLLVLAIVAVAATGAWTSYHSWRTAHNQQLTSALMAADKQGADAAKKLQMLQAFAAAHPEGSRSALALLHAGALAADQNDKDQAIKIFDSVAKDESADIAFRQLGDLSSVQLQMDRGDPADLSARLQPLTQDKAAWRFSALEDQAYLALRAGDQAKAKQIFTDLSQDTHTPQSIATRATDILRILEQETR